MAVDGESRNSETQHAFLTATTVSGLTLSFATVEDLERWIEKENPVWQAVEQGAARAGVRMGYDARPFSSIAAISNTLWQYKSAIIEPTGAKKQLFDQLDSQLKHFISSGKWISEASPEGLMLRTLARTNPIAASVVWADFAGLQVDMAEHSIAYGVLIAHSIRARWPESSESARASFESEIVSAQQFYQSASNSLSLLSETHKTRAEALSQGLAQAREDAATFLSSSSEQMSFIVKSTESHLENLKRKYDNELKLRAPVAYWKDKASHHKKSVAFLGSLVIVSWGAWLYGIWLLIDRVLSQSSVPPSGNRWLPDLPNSVVLLLTLGAFLLAWLSKIVVRALLSNLHQYYDAKQRVVMAQTYLALLGEGSVSESDGRDTVLKALFRPVSTGIVRDDALPPTPLGAAIGRGT